MRHALLTVLLIAWFAPGGSPTGAQSRTNRLTAITATSAPVFVLPDNTRTPLRVLPPGTRLRVLREAGDWLRVEFPDPRWGPRVGYIERKHVDMGPPDEESAAPARKPQPKPAPAAPPAKEKGKAKASNARVWIDATVGGAHA